MRLLRLGAVLADQLAGDLRAGAERAGADPAARQFFRDQAHRQLPQTQPAIALVDADPEHAQLRHLVDQLDRDQRIGEMPALRMRGDPSGGEGAELAADHVERLVVEAFVGYAPLGKVVRQRRTVLHGAALVEKAPNRGVRGKDARRIGGAEFGGADKFALAHRQRAGELVAIFAEADRQRQLLNLAEAARGLDPRRPVGNRLQRGDCSADPGETMDAALLALDQRGVGLSAGSDQSGGRRAHRLAILARGGAGPAGRFDPVVHRNPPIPA